MRAVTRDDGPARSIVDLIGDTPLLDLHRTVAHAGVKGRLLCKLESLNPGFSTKDRVALEMTRDAKADGRLYEGQVPSTAR